mgnify:CR=1 FL=1
MYGGFYKFDGGSLYREAGNKYHWFADKFPEKFVNIAKLFSNDRTDTHEDFFIDDNIHYTILGSVWIALAMINSCIKVNACPIIDESALKIHTLADDFSENPIIQAKLSSPD